ncbi:hypothetical protein ACFQ6Q_11300 [Streptomyces sp. NPDC056437]|uniref:hypothetical protein n=1 Tax=Streptomyces sp. NPDC056437 TaxID=3345816 RepID=UPI00367AFA47
MYATTTPARVLVVGPTATPDDVDNLRGYALDVADQIGVSATYALHNEYRVTDFEAVYVLCASTELHDTVGLVLMAEALAAGMPVHEPQSPREAAQCVCGQSQTVRTVIGEDGSVWCAECRDEVAGCAHCAELPDMEEMALVDRDSTWIPVHAGCLATAVATIPGAEFVTA